MATKRKSRPSPPRVIQAALQTDSGAILLPVNERGLPPQLVARFDRVKRKLARTDLKPAARRAAEDELTNILTAPAEAAERASIALAVAETLALAEARGEDVEPAKAGGGPARVMSRGGLRQAYEDHHLDPEHGKLRADDLYSAGRAYRDDYEAVEGQRTGERGGGGGFAPKAPQVRLIEAGHRLAAKRKALTPRQLEVVDMVCGEDVRLRTAATQLGRGFLGCRNSLRGALAILAAFKMSDSDAKAMAAAMAGLDAKSAAIARAAKKAA